MDLNALPEPLRRIILTDLAEGETVRWVGQPAPPRFSLPVGPVLMGLFMAGFGVFWMSGAASSPGGGIFALFGLLPVCAGVGMAISPFLLWGRLQQAAATTAYVITDRRAIVLGGYRPEHVALMQVGVPVFLVGAVLEGAGNGLRSYPPLSLSEICRNQHADGTGDVIFRREALGRTVQAIGFFAVRDARGAEMLLLELASETRTTPLPPPPFSSEPQPAPSAVPSSRSQQFTPSRVRTGFSGSDPVVPPTPAQPSALPPSGLSVPGRSPTPSLASILGALLVVGVALVVVFVIVLRPRWYSDVTASRGRFTGQSGGLTLTVTKVEASPSRFRIHLTATNQTSDSLTLPIFGYFYVQDSAGRQYKAEPFASTFPEKVSPGGTISGYAEVHEPLAPGAGKLKVGFSTVFGSFDVKDISVDDVRLR